MVAMSLLQWCFVDGQPLVHHAWYWGNVEAYKSRWVLVGSTDEPSWERPWVTCICMSLLAYSRHGTPKRTSYFLAHSIVVVLQHSWCHSLLVVESSLRNESQASVISSLLQNIVCTWAKQHDVQSHHVLIFAFFLLLLDRSLLDSY